MMKSKSQVRAAPKVIDLYSGVGGLSLGAARAGFTVEAAVELDSIACNYHALNFPETKHIEKDVSRLSGRALLEITNLNSGELDGLIGGPPCQGFSAIGRREANDPRNDLFVHFFRLISEIRPKFFLVENVPGILDERNRYIVDSAFALLPREYENLVPIRIRASDLGAPTTRTRIFFIGYRPDAISPIDVNEVSSSLIGQDITVSHALTGLPRIFSTWATESQSWRDLGDLPNDKFFSRVVDAIPRNVGHKATLQRLKNLREISGCFGTLHTKETVARFDALRPGEVDRISKGQRLHPDGLCPTLRAGTARDRGAFQAVRPIHYSSPRVITPREAARLQGFPDWFLFHPTKWHSFRQIGNSISPIVAEAIMVGIRKAILR